MVIKHQHIKNEKHLIILHVWVQKVTFKLIRDFNVCMCRVQKDVFISCDFFQFYQLWALFKVSQFLERFLDDLHGWYILPIVNHNNT